MSELGELLATVLYGGVELRREGAELAFRAPKGALTPELRERLATHKADLVSLLQDRARYLACSYAQERLWFLQQLDPNSPVYNVASALRLEGPLDVAALNASLNQIVQRHETLRTTFMSLEGIPIQVIHPAFEFDLRSAGREAAPGGGRGQIVDVMGQSQAELEAELDKHIAQEVRRGFDLVQGPLMRTHLFRLADQEHVLLLTLDHIIADGWSIEVFYRELEALYNAFAAGQPSPLPVLSFQYSDFARWQRQWLQGQNLDDQLAYWTEQLSGAPPVMNLPISRPRPPVSTFDGARHCRALPLTLAESIRALSRQEKATIFMTLLAAVNTLLYRYSGQEDVVIGTPIANRNRAELEGLMGFFVNTLAQRNRLSGSLTFRQLMRQVREVSLGALAHQDLPFERLVEKLQPDRSLSHHPVFQVTFSVENQPPASLALHGLTTRLLDISYETTKFDLTLAVLDTGQELKIEFSYNKNLFERDAISRMADHFQTLLQSIVADPDQRLADLLLLSEAERRCLLVEWNGTHTDYVPDRCIHELVQEQATTIPDAIAVASDGNHLTFRELDCQANQVACQLQAAGVGPEVVVGICMDRSPEMIIGMLGVLKAGGVYMPLDPAHPAQRLGYMLRDSNAAALLTQQHLSPALSDLHLPITLIHLDTDGRTRARPSPASVTSAVSAENLAYVIYTSGSTGTPKGVQVPHQGLLNLVLWHQQALGISPGDRATQVAGLSFDASVLEIWSCLAAGASLHIPDEETRSMPEQILKWLVQEKITLSFLPTPLAEAVMGLEWPPSAALRTMETGGDKLNRYPAPDLSFELVNNYGPTENSVATTSGHVPSSPQSESAPSIGRPISNTQVYILDAHGQPVPIGIPGELHIGGDGLARGYLNRPDLTAEAFIPNPYSRKPGARLYRTGDLVRYRPDGEIEFLRRIDYQVKIRGFRIELGEIEAVLGQHPQVRESVVLAREDQPGNKQLVAYVVGIQPQAPTIGELYDFLRDRLPDYMVPSAFVSLESLPLTPNGKIDRRALPAPDAASSKLGGTHVAPRTPAEERLAGIWAQVLNLEQVGIHDNFFEIGGHSLLATQIVSRLRQAFRVELPLRDLFKFPTVAELAAEIARRKGTGEYEDSIAPLPTIAPAMSERYQPFPLTDVQQAYWIGRSGDFELGNIASHGYIEFERVGLDLARFEAALGRLITRHDMLRIIVRPDGQQQILEHVPPYRIEVLDLRGLPPDVLNEQLDAVRQQMSHQVLPTDRWPLFEIRASRLDQDRIRLHLSMDALICDAWSWQIISRELRQLYQDPQTTLAPLEISFRDYVLAGKALCESDFYKRSLAYWQNRLQTLPPAPELSLARSPGALTQPHFVRRQASLKPEIWHQLKKRATRSGLTPSGVLLAAFAEVLTVWSKSPRFTINLTLFNRLPLHPQVNDIVGDYTSLTLLAIDNTGRDGFETRARRIQEQLWDDLDHRYVSGVHVLRELSRRQGGASRAAMPVVFTSALTHTMPTGTGSSQPDVAGQVAPDVDPFGDGIYSISQTPQVWLDHQVSEHDGALVFSWDAVQDLFPAGLLDDMFSAYRDFIERLATEERAWQRPTRQLVPQAQLDQRTAVNATAAPVSSELLHTLFVAQALRRPHETAVICGNRTISYQELYRRSNQIGRWLRQRGTRPNTLAAIVMHKGWEQVVAALGILQSGAAYLPIDPDLPQERIQHLLEHGQVTLALTQPWLEQALAWPDHIERFCVDDALERVDDSPLSPAQQQQDLAYVIYTSGSTGLPKGVMIDHRGAVNTILDINQRFRIGPNDRALALSSLNFDLSVYDIFGILAAGGAIVMPDAAARRDPAHWLERLARDQVTVWNSVPALMEMLVEFMVGRSERLPSTLRLVMLSGDWIPITLPNRIWSLGDKIRVISLGGATEASIWSILYPIERVDPDWKSIPYGRPMLNQTFHVLDEQLEPRPTWAPGQLHIGGIGLAQGYWRDEDKTRRSFIIHPETGEKLYRTGDLGRYLPDGNIEFLGREDLQVKIQGYRIELGEIEAALGQHPAVREAVITAVSRPDGKKQLVAYVVPNRSPDHDGKTVGVPAKSLLQDYEPSRAEEVILDPVARLRFKLQNPGLRKEENRLFVQLLKPGADEAVPSSYVTRRSYRRFASRPIPFEQFSRFLSSLWRRDLKGVPLPKSQYGSAGSLYPVQVYLYVKPGRVEGIDAGAYYYQPLKHQLVRLSEDARVDRGIYQPGNQEIFDAAAFAIFLIAQLDAVTPLYGEWAKDFGMLEAGAIVQLLEMQAPAHQMGLCQIGGLDFGSLRRWFALGENHLYLHSLLGGPIDARQSTLAALVQDSDYLLPFLELIEQDPESKKRNATGQAEPPRVSSGIPESQSDRVLFDELRDSLAAKLPKYMVPSAFVLLDRLPLTPNGKVDRQALPSPQDSVQPDARQEGEAPSTPVHQVLTSLCAKLLGVERIGLHDNFFELGGHSLFVAQLASRLRQLLQVEIPLRVLFESATVAQLADAVAVHETKPGQADKIARVLQKVESTSIEEARDLLQTKGDQPR